MLPSTILRTKQCTILNTIMLKWLMICHIYCGIQCSQAQSMLLIQNALEQRFIRIVTNFLQPSLDKIKKILKQERRQQRSSGSNLRGNRHKRKQFRMDFLKINCKYRQEESLKQINCVGGINNGEQCFVIGNNGEHGLAQMKPCQSLHIGVESTKSSL